MWLNFLRTSKGVYCMRVANDVSIRIQIILSAITITECIMGRLLVLSPYLPTCLKQEVGQTSRKSGICGLKVGHSYKFDINSRKWSSLAINYCQKKKRDRMKKKRDSSNKSWTTNRDCPSESGTVGGYVSHHLHWHINQLS